MADHFSYTGLLTSLFLPWFIGCVWVKYLLEQSGRWNYFVVAGQGYLLGVFLTTIVIRLGFAIGIDLHFWQISTALLFFGIFGLLVQQLRWPEIRKYKERVIEPSWQKVVLLTLLGLIAWRYLNLLQELMTRPLYSWDAWMNWAPKAIVWFNLDHFANFVNPDQWLQQSANTHNYTLGNYHASDYPPSVPIIMLWSMMGAGTSDNGLIFLPWALLAIALGIALYGHLRLAGLSTLLSTIAVYVLLSMPYFNVHIALAGYADIWLAAAFGMAIFALHEWTQCRHWSYGILCIILGIFCSQLKNPGIVLGAIVLLTFIRSMLRLDFRKELAFLAIISAALVYTLIFGATVQIPFVGEFSISRTQIDTPMLGSFALEYHPLVTGAFIETLFFMLNWNILWYLITLLLVAKLLKGDITRQASAAWLGTFLALAFIFFVFYFTYHYDAALNFGTVNRALLYPVAALVFLFFKEVNLHISKE